MKPQPFESEPTSRNGSDRESPSDRARLARQVAPYLEVMTRRWARKRGIPLDDSLNPTSGNDPGLLPPGLVHAARQMLSERENLLPSDPKSAAVNEACRWLVGLKARPESHRNPETVLGRFSPPTLVTD